MGGGRLSLAYRSPVHFHGINYADDGCVDRALFTPESHARGAALHDQHCFVNACAHGINCDDVPLFVPAFNINKTRDKQLSPVKALILSRRYYSTNYSSKNHKNRYRVQEPSEVSNLKLQIPEPSFTSHVTRR